MKGRFLSSTREKEEADGGEQELLRHKYPIQSGSIKGDFDKSGSSSCLR